MEYLAHSARDGCPAQGYDKHIGNVTEDAVNHARAAARYAQADGDLLIRSVYNAALYHDLGKLNTENQEILHKADSYGSLPVPHQDAGVARLKELPNSFFSQIAVFSHHSGLPDMPHERTRKNDTSFRADYQNLTKVNAELTALLERHEKLMPQQPSEISGGEPYRANSVFYRILLSCLADADHTDTARHYHRFPVDETMPDLRAQERLESLDAYVKGLQSAGSSPNERNHLRREMYETCRNTVIRENIAACDSPVGSGKTTAVMAHLLKRAADTNARRIFVVLPYTNIIEQSVDTYRKALVLPGENPESVVAELHHRADFESEDLYALSSVWRAPIIVTTAVAFFETLASSRPSALRRLHELPGSVIFVDEAHAAVPANLLSVTWEWMTELADRWDCYWVLASGSLVKFWEIEELGARERCVPQVLPDELRSRLGVFENNRIEYRFKQTRMTVAGLTDWVSSFPGPRLVIMNTVKNAAVVADAMREKLGADHVLHISTALKSEDRKRTIDTVKARLADPSDTDWTLVATSCVEAGVDFSFKTGFREVSSLLSLLQAAGRVNRGGKDENAVIWSFRMRDDEPGLNTNPALKDSAVILTEYFEDETPISPELSTDAIRQELCRNTNPQKGAELLKTERAQLFPDVNEQYHIIENDSVSVIVDDDLKQAILHGGCGWKEIQKRAVSVSFCKIKKYGLPELAKGIYDWNLRYDSFLGIMRGVLDIEKTANTFLNV